MKIQSSVIPQNIVPDGTKKIVIMDNNNEFVGSLSIDNISPPSDLGIMLYSVGVVSDIHIFESEYSSNTTRITDSHADLARAIKYFSNNVNMLCACGDLGEYNQALTKYTEIRDLNKGSMLIYEAIGNHEHFVYPSGTESVLSNDQVKELLGHPIYYTVSNQADSDLNYYCDSIGDDVFIFCGAVRWSSVFNEESFNWLSATLESNKDKRCFLFMHGHLESEDHIYCGDSTDVLTFEMLSSYKTSFIELLKKYPNVLYFHGHTHAMLEMQNYTQMLDEPRPANYDYALGCHSIHVPSLSMSRDISSGAREDLVSTSEGWLMEVYENYVILRGLDFANGTTDSDGVYKPAFIPIATYCLKTI